ncbi:MAG: prephenate dehydrogenase/arogenate dehydrogenase family protein [Actinomycetota bacterium]
MKAAILGCGLIGGSIGLALKGHPGGPSEIVVFDRELGAARAAVDRGAADRFELSAAAAVAAADVVFVATPVRSIATAVADAVPGLKPGAILTDVGSTKTRVVVEVESLLPAGVFFVGGHPMAGSEQEGIAGARGDLFEGAWWILTPTEGSQPATYQFLHGVLTALGARIMALKPEQHDDLMATVSHLPQLVATTVMNMAADRGKDHAGLLALAAGGFRDVTRVAASNPDIWLDICRDNKDAIVIALGEAANRLLALRDLVQDEDLEGLGDVLAAAREARKSLPGKATEGEAYEIRVPVPDRPGVLAEVTTSVGNLGVNIEGLDITHAEEGGQGFLRLSILGADNTRRVREILQRLGYEPTDTEL